MHKLNALVEPERDDAVLMPREHEELLVRCVVVALFLVERMLSTSAGGGGGVGVGGGGAVGGGFGAPGGNNVPGAKLGASTGVLAKPPVVGMAAMVTCGPSSAASAQGARSDLSPTTCDEEFPLPVPKLVIADSSKTAYFDCALRFICLLSLLLPSSSPSNSFISLLIILSFLVTNDSTY